MIYDNDFKQLAFYLVRTLEAFRYSYRTVEEVPDYNDVAYELLRKHGFVDSNGLWKDDEE